MALIALNLKTIILVRLDAKTNYGLFVTGTDPLI